MDVRVHAHEGFDSAQASNQGAEVLDVELHLVVAAVDRRGNVAGDDAQVRPALQADVDGEAAEKRLCSYRGDARGPFVMYSDCDSEMTAALRRDDDGVTTSAQFSQDDGLVCVGILGDGGVVGDFLE